MCHFASLSTNISRLGTHQQPRRDRDDVGCGVFGGDVFVGFGNVAEDVPVDDGSDDEVNVADEDER